MAAVMDFVPHLRCHSEFSLTHGMLRLDGEHELGKLAASKGIGAVALTDTNNIHAAVRHQRSCLRHGVKPILGCHALWTRSDRRHHDTLLCLDADGFRNLSHILSLAQRASDGAIDATSPPADLAGLALLTGYDGEAGSALRSGKPEVATRILASLHNRYPGAVHVELSFGGRVLERETSLHLAAIAAKLGLPVVAVHPVMFAESSDFDSHEVRTCIANASQLDDPSRPRNFSDQQYLLSARQMQKQFAKWPQALVNAAELASRCNYDFGVGSATLFPKLDIGGASVADKLRALVEQRLPGILPPGADEGIYRKRLQHELDVIISKGFADYFLIVEDLVRYAHDNDIPVGPGRGSGAGSLVAYVLGITGVDPLRYGLLFERFLNPERTALPDFDIDFCKQRREEIIAHARQKYGDDCVAQVVTFGSLKAKAVVRDVARVLGLPYATGDTISRLIPNELSITLQRARKETKELNKLLKAEERHERLWTYSLALEGMPRQPSTHASAILITPGPIVDYCPVARIGGSDTGKDVSQYDKDDAEGIGLVKFDILGLKNLTMLRLARTQLPELDWQKVSLEDDRTMDIYRQGRTVGVFQCESAGMIRLLMQIRPASIDDIALTISMYRPGVLASNMHQIYLDNRAGKTAVNYPHELVRSILAPTYGVMIYQEQVMQISQALAGFSLAKADKLRAAIGKKNVEAMASLERDFLDGCSKHLPRERAEQLFSDINQFAGYGFNKSHAISYAVISLQTAYLKAHHPAVFYAASISTWADDVATMEELLGDARKHGIKILPPDVNASQPGFTVADKASIRFGLACLRGVGQDCAAAIAEQRESQEEDYASLDELCERLTPQLLNRRALEGLIEAGACDCLAPDGDKYQKRAWLEKELPGAIEHAAAVNRDANQDSLFAVNGAATKPAVAAVEPWTDRKLLLGEQTAMGITLSGHLAGMLRWIFKQLRFSTLKEAHSLGDGARVLAAGRVVRRLTSAAMRRQGREVFIIEDSSETMEVATEASSVDEAARLSDSSEVVVVKGSIDHKQDREPRIRAAQVCSVDTWLERNLGDVHFVASSDSQLKKLLGELAAIDKPGRTQLYIRYKTSSLDTEIDTRCRRALSIDQLTGIRRRVLGNDGIRLSLGG